MKRKLNRTAKLAFYNARNRKGDASRISKVTGYATSYITGVCNGSYSIPPQMANAMYRISYRRMKNSEVNA